MLGACLNSEVDGLVVVFHVVELFVSRLQLTENVFCFINGWLRDVYLLETANHTLRTREVTVVFLVGRRADEANSACFEIGFQHVRRIHSPLASSTCTHQGMNFVDIHDVVAAFLLYAVHNHLDAVLEVAAILCTCQQRTHVKLIDLAAFQPFWHLSFFNHPYQSPDERCLTYTRLTHVQRVVLVPAAQHLDGSLQFFLSSNQRILL